MRIESSNAGNSGEATVPAADDRGVFASVEMIMIAMIIAAKMVWPVAVNSVPLTAQHEEATSNTQLHSSTGSDSENPKCSSIQITGSIPENIAAMVTYVKGAVLISKSQQLAMVPKKGDRVRPGDLVITGVDGFVNITIDETQFAKVQPLSIQSFDNLVCPEAVETDTTYTIVMPFLTGSVRG